MKLFVILSFLLIFSCCTKKSAYEKFYYIIKHTDKIQVDTSDIPLPPSPPLMYYGQHNFVLIDTSQIFYHDNYVFYSCGTGIDFSKPPRLFLTPDSLTEIKINDLSKFLKNHIPGAIKNGRWISANISSSSDTIKNRAFKLIIEYFKTKDITRYGIRNWTEEENFATTAKLNKSPYDPKTADFKNGFDIVFVPPVDSIKN